MVQANPFPLVGIAIGTGTPAEAAAAGARYGAGLMCLADQDQSVYRAYAVEKATLRAYAQWSVLRDGISALWDGYGMSNSHGDVTQMPATFVIDTSGVVRLAAYAQTISEFPRESDLLRALKHSI